MLLVSLNAYLFTPIIYRCEQICKLLADKGFASTNVVFGIGSYTYQYVTRDTYSIACKATWVQISGVAKSIFKDPKTGDGMKKSAKGLLSVIKRDNGVLVLLNDCSPEQEKEGELTSIFLNGASCNSSTFSEIKKRLSLQT
ncbi:MAG TPA: hypothetical protein PKX31_00035 [Chitinophagaceae bacterium]|nr:hypothetical protein [Chitinophagaceae bacterium]